MEKQQHRVVVVGTTSISDQIATAFLGLFGTKFWIRGPEGPQRFAIAKTLLSKVFHDVELEPKPLSSNGTKSLYALLTEVDARGTIIKFKGAEIAQAIRSVKQGLHRDLYNTRSWVKVSHILTSKSVATKNTIYEDRSTALPQSIYLGALPRCITYGVINYSLSIRSCTRGRSF